MIIYFYIIMLNKAIIPAKKGVRTMETKEDKKLKWEKPELVRISQVGESALCSGSLPSCDGTGSQLIF